MDQYRVYHAQVQAESSDEIRQLITKLNLSFDHLLERVGSLETRSNALERLQDALEQRIEFLDDRRDRHADQNEVKIERLEEQATQNTSLLTMIDKRVTEIEVKGGTGLISGYNTGALGRLQDALEQRIEFLDDRRDNPNQITIQHIDASTPNTSMLSTSVAVADAYFTSGYNTDSTEFGSSEVPITPNYQGFGETNVPPQRVEALHTRVVELEHSVDRALSSCLDQELRIQLLERATYNGVLLWKIEEFGR